jgi:hypothetical protein
VPRRRRRGCLETVVDVEDGVETVVRVRCKRWSDIKLSRDHKATGRPESNNDKQGSHMILAADLLYAPALALVLPAATATGRDANEPELIRKLGCPAPRSQLPNLHIHDTSKRHQARHSRLTRLGSLIRQGRCASYLPLRVNYTSGPPILILFPKVFYYLFNIRLFG